MPQATQVDVKAFTPNNSSPEPSTTFHAQMHPKTYIPRHPSPLNQSENQGTNHTEPCKTLTQTSLGPDRRVGLAETQGLTLTWTVSVSGVHGFRILLTVEGGGLV